MSDDLKKRIRTRLNELGKTARAASLDAGLGSDAIRNVLNDRAKSPRGDTLRDLAYALQCSLEWLLTGRDDPTPVEHDAHAKDLLQRVDQRLREMGLSDREASLRATGSVNTIRSMRRGSTPGVDKLLRLAPILGTSVNWLVTGKDEGDISSYGIVPHKEVRQSLIERINQRLTELDLSARKASLLASNGQNPELIRNIQRGKSVSPRGETMCKLAQTLQCSLDWLVAGQKSAQTRTSSPPSFSPVSASRPSDAQSIPEINIRTSTNEDGNGGLKAANEICGSWSLPSEYLCSELRINAHSARIIEVQGDSMEPTLKAGDRIMVNLSDKKPSPPGIFALWDGFGVVVKRVEHIPTSEPPTFKIKSDHDQGEYERPASEVNIIGRVVWFGRKM